jgi:site-specific DNA recombinase
MMISWVMPVNPSHPYLENDPAPSFAPTICAFHLGFSLDPENRISHVIFHDLSRFTRSKADPQTYLKILDENNITIHLAQDGTNSDDDNELLWDIQFIFNHLFSKTISQLTIRGQSESVKMGNDISPVVAYGFEKYHVEEGGRRRPRWRPHPEHAKHLRLIFAMREQKHLPMAICNHMNGLGIPAPKGGLWRTGTIISILRNIAYLGYSQVGKKSTSQFPKHRRKRKLVQNPKAHPALVAEKLFNSVQALMPKQSRPEREPPRSHDSPNPVSNRVKCRRRGHIANMVVANSKNGRKKLTCGVKKSSGIKQCDTPDVELDDFLKTVGRALKERLSTPSIIQEQLELLIKNSGEMAEREKKRQKAIAKRLKEIDSEKDVMMAGFRHAKEKFPENVSDFNKALSALNKELEELEQQRKDINEDTAELMAFLADPEGVLEALQELGNQIDPEDLEVTSRFLKSFIDRVDIWGDEATMYYKLPLTNTVETPDGYRASAPIEHGGPEILLEQCAPLRR